MHGAHRGKLLDHTIGSGMHLGIDHAVGASFPVHVDAVHRIPVVCKQIHQLEVRHNGNTVSSRLMCKSQAGDSPVRGRHAIAREHPDCWGQLAAPALPSSHAVMTPRALTRPRR